MNRPEVPESESRPGDPAQWSGSEGRPPGATAAPEVQVQYPATRPVVTYVLLGLTVLVFLGQLAGEYFLGGDILALLGMKHNAGIFAGEYWRLITPMFLHGSILHVAFNMYALNSFGPLLERHFGHGRFLILYLVSGFAGNVVSMTFSPYNAVGSSTAIYGLLGAEGIFLLQNRQLLGRNAQAALRNILFIAVLNLMISLSPGIDLWGHLGGLVGGVLFTALAGPVFALTGGYPEVQIEDQRGPGVGLLAGILVFGLFAGLAVAKIFFLN